jgi:hypothetical protein
MVPVERPKSSEKFVSREKIRKWKTGIRDEYNSKHLNNAVGVEKKCKYCGGMHEWNQSKCPAYPWGNMPKVP